MGFLSFFDHRNNQSTENACQSESGVFIWTADPDDFKNSMMNSLSKDTVMIKIFMKIQLVFHGYETYYVSCPRSSFAYAMLIFMF